MNRTVATLAVGVISLLSNPVPASACGGAVAPDQAVVIQSQQRVLISLEESGTTHVVVQLSIPSADVAFGALTPVGGLPTIDAEPVDTAEMDALELQTRPVLRSGPDTSPGCGCGSADQAGDGRGGVNVIQVVDIGPVTAAALGADTGAALSQWLADNGFVVPATDQALVDSYVGPGKYFVAFKRNSQAGSGPSSVGVTYSVAGDHRGYAMRMSRLGADARLGIQVYVAAPETISPTGSAPAGNFQTLTLTDFAKADLHTDYTEALFQGIAERGSKAFVLEGVYDSKSGWRDGLGPRLSALTEPGQVLSRLATVVARDQLTEDVAFTGNAPKNVPKEAWLTPAPGQQRDAYLALCGLAFVSWSSRRALRVRKVRRCA